MRWIVLLIGLVLASPAAAAPPLWGALEPGRYAVGVQILEKVDESRPGLADDRFGTVEPISGRTMQVTVWYPAQAPEPPKPKRWGRKQTAAPKPLAVADYVLLDASQVNLWPDDARRAAAIAAFSADLRKRGAGDAAIQRLLATPTAAVRDAPAANGRFPLLIFAHLDPQAAAITAEFLASHGYLVASIPWKGTYGYALDVGASGVETQATDMAYVKGLLRTDPRADVGQIGLMGMSFGALSATSLAMRDREIDAVVSLDGGIGSPGVWMLKAGPYYNLKRLTASVGHFYGPDVPGGDLAWFKEATSSERLIAPYPGLAHEDFTSTPMYDVALGLTPADGPKARGFERLNRDVLGFLETAFRGATPTTPEGARRMPAGLDVQ